MYMHVNRIVLVTTLTFQFVHSLVPGKSELRGETKHFGESAGQVCIAIMILKVWSIIVSLLVLASLVRYGITFESKGSSSAHSDNSNLHHTSNNHYDDDYPYVVTIDPESEKAVDDKPCHPASGASEPSVPCKTLDYAFEQFAHLSDVKFLLNAPNHTYTLNLTPNFMNVNNIGIFGNSSLYPMLPVVECILLSHEAGTGLTFINSDNIVLESVHFLNCSASQKVQAKIFPVPNRQHHRVVLIC